MTRPKATSIFFRFISLLILHAFELAVMYYIGTYIYNYLEMPINIIAIGILVFIYVLYIVIARFKDYKALFVEPFKL